jgi:hypothetical protein
MLFPKTKAGVDLEESIHTGRLTPAPSPVIRNPLNCERLGTAPHRSPHHGFRIFFPLAPLEKILKSTRFFGFRMTVHRMRPNASGFQDDVGFTQSVPAVVRLEEVWQCQSDQAKLKLISEIMRFPDR